MLKKMLFTSLPLLVLTGAGAGDTVLPWSSNLNRVGNWKINSSGKMTKAYDAKEQALMFSVKFRPKSDFWIYPQYQLKPNESLERAKSISFEIKASQPDNKGYKLSLVMLVPGGYLPYPHPTGKWTKVNIKLDNKKNELKKVRYLRIGMNPKSQEQTFWLRNIQIKGTPAVKKLDASYAIKAHAPGTVFTDKQPLQFSLRQFSAMPVEYMVKDWQGKAVAAGKWPEGGKGTLTLKSLPRGYYTINLANCPGTVFTGSRSFAIVPDPASRPVAYDSFFAADTALSWLTRSNRGNVRYPGDGGELLARLCQLAGLKMVRERLSWSGVQPGKGDYNWRQYFSNASMICKYGMTISGMYHNAPKWTKDTSAKLPDDMFETYGFAKTLAQKFKGKMYDWEFWNEQDGGFATAGAWDYASAMKAAYLGFKAGDRNLPVLLGSFCVYPLNEYHNLVFENDVADYIDVFNYHIYGNLAKYPMIINSLKSLMKQYGMADMPIWITENGTNAEGPSRVQSYIPGYKAHSPEQEMIVAEFTPKSQIYLQSLGIAKDFFFVFAPYNERGGAKDWGAIRRDYSVKPGYVAFSTLTNQLARAKCLGQINVGKGIRAFLYEQPDKKQTVVFWSLSSLDTKNGGLADAGKKYLKTFDLAASDGKYELVNMVGGESKVVAKAGKVKLASTRYPSYINGLSGLKPSVPAVKAPPLVLNKAKKRKDLSIVYKVILTRDFVLNSGKYSVNMKGKDSGRLKLMVYNLDHKAKTGKLKITGAEITGLPDVVKLPAMGKAEFDLYVKPEISHNNFSGKMVVNGVFDGKSTSCLNLPFECVYKVLGSSEKLKELKRAMKGESWRANSSGKMNIAFDEKEQAMRFDVDFPKGVDRWVYPEYVLRLPEESFEDVIAFAFDIKVPDKQNKAMRLAYLMLVGDTVKEHGKTTMFSYSFPSDEWQTRLILLKGKDVSRTRMLRLGMNPRTGKFSYWIRNIRLVYKNK